MSPKIRLKQIALLLVFASMPVQTNSVFGDELIRSGDSVQLNYVCRLKTGEVADTTLAESKLASEDKKSSIFQPLQNDAPLSLTAGDDPRPTTVGKHHDFADVIAEQLARGVVGMRADDHKTVEVMAQEAESRQNGAFSLAKVRRRPKELRLLPAEYKNRTGKEAAIGQEFTIDPAFPGKVVTVSPDEVLISFAAPADKTLQTPFGPATIRETDKLYLVDIDARIGALVRSGPMVGKIVKVDDKMFTVDYGNPLAGQDLYCEVTVLSVAKNQQGNEEGKKNYAKTK